MFGELLRYSKRKYLTVDTETEGLCLFCDRPWSIAWLVCQGDNILESHNRFLKWSDLKVRDGAARVTNFNPAVIEEKGEDPKTVINDLLSYLYDPQYYIVAQNILNYDVYVINNACNKLGITLDYSFLKRTYDSNAIARAIAMGITYKKDGNLLEFQYRLSNSPRKGIKTSLGFLGKKYKLEFNESELHGALKDATLNHKVWRELIKEIEI